MMKKRAFGFFLILALVTSALVVAFASDNNGSDDRCVYSIHYNQANAMRNSAILRSKFPQSRTGEVIYPPNFGGFVIDDDGHMVVLVVGSIYDFKSSFDDEIIEAFEGRFRNVEFSHQMLRDISNFLMDFWINNPCCDLRNSMLSSGISCDENRIRLTLSCYSYIYEFRSHVIDSPALVIDTPELIPEWVAWQEVIQAETAGNDTIDALTEADVDEMGTALPRNTVIMPGDRIYTINGGGSAGFGVRRGSALGFVTTPHDPVGWTVNTDVRLGSSWGPIIGRITPPVIYRHEVDAAMVGLQGMTVFQNAVEGRVINDIVTWFYVGQDLRSISTPANSWTRVQEIRVTQQSYNSWEMGLFGLIRTNGQALHGESGGLVYALQGSWGASAAGIIVGISAHHRTMVFSPASHINSMLGTSLSGSVVWRHDSPYYGYE